jgi:hypothetical protein
MRPAAAIMLLAAACIGSPRRAPSSSAATDRPGPRDDIKRTLAAHHDEIRSCYEQARLAHPGLAGLVDAELTIDAGGAVVRATAAGLDPYVDACIVKVLHSIAFPPPTGVVTVAFPFVFSAD